MSYFDVTLGIASTLIFIVWVFSISSWMKRGMPIPRYIHILAGALTLVGGVILVITLQGDLFGWQLGLACLVLPAPATYFGWLWMFGPEFTNPGN